MYIYFLQGRNADSLCQYFGEDPARCPFEQGMNGSDVSLMHGYLQCSEKNKSLLLSIPLPLANLILISTTEFSPGFLCSNSDLGRLCQDVQQVTGGE